MPLLSLHLVLSAADFPTYAHRAVRHSLAGDPDRVSSFLFGVCHLMGPTVKRMALDELTSLVHRSNSGGGCGGNYHKLCPWDIPFGLGIRRLPYSTKVG